MTHQRNAKLKGVLPVIVVMAIILFMSTLPAEQAGDAIEQVSRPPRQIIRQVPVLPRTIRVRWGKVGHVIGYGVLGLVLYRAIMLTCLRLEVPSGHLNRIRTSGDVWQGTSGHQEMSRQASPGLLLPTLIVFGFACLDEFVQYFVPGRSAQLSDVILDTTAALIVMVVIKLVADSS